MTRTELVIFYFVLFTHSVFAQSWQKMEAFPGADRDDALALSNGQKAIFFSGNAAGAESTNTVYLFRADSNTWRTTTEFPGVERQYAGGFVIDDTAYVVGGHALSGGLQDFWAFDFKSESWTQKEVLPFHKRWSFACFAALKKGFVVGGTDGLERNAEVWMFDPKTQKWSQRQDFPGGPRRELVAGVSRNRAYIGLGFNDFNNDEFFNDWWKYETIQDVWTKMKHYPVDALGWAEAMSGASFIGVAGGSGPSGTFANESYWFDLVSEEWMKSAEITPEGYRGCSSFETDEHVYVLTGLLENSGRKTELFRLAYPEQTSYRPFAYPNPVVNSCKVFVPEFSTLVLFDATGKHLETHESTSVGYVQLERHNPGVYYVQIQSEYAVSEIITLIYY